MKAQKFLVSQLVPGMTVAKDIYTYNNLLIISTGTVLNDRIISRLKFYSIPEVIIDISVKSKSEVLTKPKKAILKKVLLTPKQLKALMNIKFNTTFLSTVSSFSQSLKSLLSDSPTVDCGNLLSTCDALLSASRNKLHLFDMIHCIKTYSDITYVHSINVALICNAMGNWMNYSEEDIQILTLCGLLHDVGKLCLPSSLVNKTTKLTDKDYETIKKHTIKGYQILKDKDIDERIKYVALLHHERCDGTGYPNGFTSTHINDFSKIVAIADVYDAMTSPRVYRKSICPFEVISIFESEGYTKYDPKFLIPFLTGIISTYLHNTVQLSNGMIGEIVLINQHYFSKPIVQVDDEFIDLSKEHSLHITAVL